MPSTKTWLELLPHVAQVCTPVVQAGMNYHFDSKLIEKRRTHEVELAERRAEGLQKMSALSSNTAKQAAAGAGAAAAAAGAGAAHEASGGNQDVYDRLDQIESETKCGACRTIAQRLQGESEGVAQQGERELRQLVEKRRELEQAGATKDTARQEMGAMMDQWEVVPDVLAGVA